MAWVHADAASLQVCHVRLAGARPPAHVALSGECVWLPRGRAWVHFLAGGVLVASSPRPSREGESQNTEVDNTFKNCSAFLVFTTLFFLLTTLRNDHM